MSSGMLFKIQKFCLDDGPGIRTTVFLKGCNLHCSWCHNKEGIKKEPSIGFFIEKCQECHACETVCPTGAHQWGNGIHQINRTLCIHCNKCVDVCVYHGIKQIGREYLAEEVMEEIKKDIPFYRQSGGGMTLSGGEPLLQADFCKELAGMCKKVGISVALETAGHVKKEVLEQLIPYISIWLYDIKESREDIFFRETGGNLKVVMDNLKLLKERKCDVILRCPIVPGIQDREQHLKFLAQIAKGTNGIQIMPYHNTGMYKAAAYGVLEQGDYPVPTKEEIEKWNQMLLKFSSQ